jgi:malonate-semialdehyde dehydrogenase (acetylating)/methylmalonate-semialdehyde dehydrogenase
MEISMNQPEVKNFINGKFERNGQKSLDIESPSTGEVISTLPMSTASDLDLAVKAAENA